MHEMSLCESVLQIIEDEAAAKGFGKVKRVHLEIGALAGVDPEALRFCFDVVAHGTLIEGATLDIIQPPGQGWCMPCGLAVTLAERYAACPHCGSYQLQVTGGDEMRIKELEVE